MLKTSFARAFLLLTMVLFAVSCGDDSDGGGGFDGVIDPNATLEGVWTSVAYDFTKTDVASSQLDSVFSFTGGILKEEFKENGERIRTFLGFPDTYTYTRVDNRIELTKGNEVQVAKILTLSSSHFAYSIERFVVENDTSKREFTSAQLVR